MRKNDFIFPLISCFRKIRNNKTKKKTSVGIILLFATSFFTIGLVPSINEIIQDNQETRNSSNETGLRSSSFSKDYGGIPICDSKGGADIISDCSGGFIIAWGEKRTNNYDVYAQHVNSSGHSQWIPGGVLVCNRTGDQKYPCIVSDGAGGIIVAWENTYGFSDYNLHESTIYARGPNSKIYAQKVNITGYIQWDANGILLSDMVSIVSPPTLTSDGYGGAIITWYDFSGIYAQRVDSTGTILWNTNGLPICNTVYGHWVPQIINDGVGGAIIAWEDNRNWLDEDIYAQRINSSTGMALWTPNGTAICTASYPQVRIRLECDNEGGVFLGWTDFRNDGGSYENGDIYCQKVNSSGQVQWKVNGVAVSTRSGNGYLNKIVSDCEGGAIIAWYDDKSNSRYTFAQRINSEGELQWYRNVESSTIPGFDLTVISFITIILMVSTCIVIAIKKRDKDILKK